MKLAIFERILIHGLIPTEHDYETLKAIEIFKKDLSFNKDEVAKFDIETLELANGSHQVKFNLEAAHEYEVDIKMPARVKSVLTEKLVKLNKDKKLTEQLLSLYEKFCA